MERRVGLEIAPLFKVMALPGFCAADVEPQCAVGVT